MKNWKQWTLRMTIALFVGLTSSTAFADDASSSATQHEAKRGYSYKFDDDPLAAEGSGASGLLLRIRPQAMRTLLIRARAQFITELLKSTADL